MEPGEQLQKFGVDPVRYFLLKEGSLHRDGGMCLCYDINVTTHCLVFTSDHSSLSPDYSEDRVIALLNADLADTLGNLVQRVTARKLHPSTVEETPSCEWDTVCEGVEDRALIDRLNHLTGKSNRLRGHLHELLL